MIAIQLSFPAGRWHATAWGSHVNEGVPEWPPCPWRLCRALIAAWHWKHRREEPVLRRLIEKLASAPAPHYRLPKASVAHTRHYMPVISGPKESRAKVFDTFIHIGDSSGVDSSLWIRWDVDLDETERALLAALLESLSYLGRAESLVAARLSDVLPSNGRWAIPSDGEPHPDKEQIRLLSPSTPDAYITWKNSAEPTSGPKKTKGKSKKAASSFPESLFDALQLDTADWKKEGRDLPPGARWLEYSRPRDALRVAPSGLPRRTLAKPVTVARFAIVSKVPPSITQALSLGERFHQGLCSYLEEGVPSPNLTGCDTDKQPLKGNNHAYFLPECDAHGYVTHMTVHAPGGFDVAACRAFGRLPRVWGTEGFDLNVVLLATGQAADFASVSPYFRKAKVWRSLSPFVPVRHAKATRTGIPKIDPATQLQIGSPEHDCWRLIGLLASEEHPLPVKQVRRVGPGGARVPLGLREVSCLDFQRKRRTGEGTHAGHTGYALEIEFVEETALPLGFGYGSHFGLGLFVPVA